MGEAGYFMSLVAFIDIVIPILMVVLLVRAMVILATEPTSSTRSSAGFATSKAARGRTPDPDGHFRPVW